MACHFDAALTAAVFHDWTSILSKAEAGHLIRQRLPSTCMPERLGRAEPHLKFDSPDESLRRTKIRRRAKG